MSSKTFHTPVLLKEAINGLNIKPGKKYIDATLGGGGHTREILKRSGQVLALDQDQDAIDHAAQSLANLPKLTIAKTNFSLLEQTAHQHGFDKVAGILFDLGLSSHQIDDPGRGFSFQSDAPLDMRMDKSTAVTAKDLIAALGKKELIKLFTLYSDEPLANKIAAKIVEVRTHSPITTTVQLSNLIQSVYRSRYSKRSTTNPATKVFQSLRIAINDELTSLKLALPQALNLLEANGRLAIISFHSGEDAIVKHFFSDQVKKNQLKLITKKPITASPEEIKQNPRASSAKLRVAQKLT